VWWRRGYDRAGDGFIFVPIDISGSCNSHPVDLRVSVMKVLGEDAVRLRDDLEGPHYGVDRLPISPKGWKVVTILENGARDSSSTRPEIRTVFQAHQGFTCPKAKPGMTAATTAAATMTLMVCI
jgi:hypothetical protein